MQKARPRAVFKQPQQPARGRENNTVCYPSVQLDDVQQFVCHRAQRDVKGFAFGQLLLVQGCERLITAHRSSGSQPDGTPQMGGTTLGEMCFFRRELPTLDHTRIHACISHQRFGILKPANVANLTQEYSGEDAANPTDGRQPVGNGIEVQVNFPVELFLLGFQISDLPGEQMDLQSVCPLPTKF
jgi:hypothetical protein